MKIPQAFSYFGGKNRIAYEIWERFGKINIYIEPFAGSAAVLLNSPYIVKLEILNDRYSLITNFFRSAKYAPNKTAKYAKNLVSETELHAIQDYLISQKDLLTKKLEDDLEYFDPKIAGLWVFGLNSWMGTNWCSDKTLYKRPTFSKSGINRNNVNLQEYFRMLSNRLQKTIICCGDWKRVVSDFITTKNEPMGIFLDPPYSADAGRENNLYIKDDLNVSRQVFDWCIENGKRKNFKIAFCGYSNEYEFPEDWSALNWKGNCAWANWGNNKGKDNAKKEMIWFSPGCHNSKIRKVLDIL